MLGIACIGWSVCTGAQGFAGSFTSLLFPRLGVGLFQAGTGPPAYSLITDYFPPQQRTVANAVFGIGVNIGQAMSSLTPIMIGAFGWMMAFWYIGFLGVLFGIMCIVFVKEPERGRFQIDFNQDKGVATADEAQKVPFCKKFGQGLAALFTNPTARWVLAGACCRQWQAYTIGFYAQKRFNDIYPQYQDQFSILNAFAVLVFGAISSLGTGFICDKFEEKNFWTKPYVLMAISFNAIPLSALTYMINNSFYASLTFLFLENLIGEGWGSPAISMIQTVVANDVKGVAIAVFLFSTVCCGTVATLVVGNIIQALQIDAMSPTQYGLILTTNTALPCALAIFFFYLGGKNYVEYKKCLYYCKQSNVDGIILEEFEDAQVIKRHEGSVFVKVRRSTMVNRVPGGTLGIDSSSDPLLQSRVQNPTQTVAFSNDRPKFSINIDDEK